jgi:lysophospholipase L1-like esterase
MRLQITAVLSCSAVFIVGCIAETERTEQTGSSKLALGGENAYVLALGDSLAAGHQVAPEEPGHCCSRDGYADQLHEALRVGNPKLRLHVLGCGGETTQTMIAGDGLCHYEHGSQLAEAVQWIKNKNIFAVTIDIGANDVLACLQQPNPTGCLPSTLSPDGKVAASLAEIVTTLRVAVGPDVPIIGMNYYNPLVAQWFSDPDAAINSQRSVVGPFNSLLESIYRSKGATAVADVETAFAAADFTMVQSPFGLVPMSVANVCAYTWMCSAGDIHTNTAGYRLISDAFLAVLP